MGYWLDASYLIALASPRDRHHKDALRKLALLEDDGAARHTHALALSEVSAVLLKVARGKDVARVLRDVMDDCDVRDVAREDVAAALDLVGRYGVSLSDALLISFCEEDGGTVVSYDADFKGKTRLL